MDDALTLWGLRETLKILREMHGLPAVGPPPVPLVYAQKELEYFLYGK